MLQNGKVVARFVCVLVRRAGLALCVVSSCARCGVFARCRVGVPASSWAGPQIGIYFTRCSNALSFVPARREFLTQP